MSILNALPVLPSSTQAVAPRVRTGSRVTAIGDSTVASSGNSAPFPDIAMGDGTLAPTSTATGSGPNGYPNVGTIQRGDSWLHHLCYASGGILEYAHNAGVAGNSTTDMLARITDVTANPYPADVCIIGGPTNDVGVSAIPLATTQANIKAMVAALRQVGIQPALSKVLPNNATGRPPKVAYLNAWLARYAQQQRIPIIDFYTPFVTVADGSLLSSIDSGDHTHPSNLGYQQMGAAAWTALQPYVTPHHPMLCVENFETSNLLAGGLFLVDTNADGIADNWAIQSHAQDGTFAASLSTADASVQGKAQRLTLTGAATAIYGLFQNITIASGKIAVGDRLVLSGKITNSGLTQAQMWITLTGSTALTTKIALGTSVNVTRGVEICEFIVPPGTTAVQIDLLARSGTGYCEFSQLGLYNLTKLGIL